MTFLPSLPSSFKTLHQLDADLIVRKSRNAGRRVGRKSVTLAPGFFQSQHASSPPALPATMNAVARALRATSTMRAACEAIALRWDVGMTQRAHDFGKWSLAAARSSFGTLSTQAHFSHYHPSVRASRPLSISPCSPRRKQPSLMGSIFSKRAVHRKAEAQDAAQNQVNGVDNGAKVVEMKDGEFVGSLDCGTTCVVPQP